MKMKSILFTIAFFLGSIYLQAQVKKNPAPKSACTEINFWIKQLETNFKDLVIKRVSNTGYDYTSNRSVNDFDSTGYIFKSDAEPVNSVEAFSKFATFEEAVKIYQIKKKEFESCLAAKLFKKQEESKGESFRSQEWRKAFGKKGGTYIFEMTVDPLFVYEDNIEVKKGYVLKIQLTLQKTASSDAG